MNKPNTDNSQPPVTDCGTVKGRMQRLVRLYRFFNFVKGGYGEPFALCDKHKAEQPVPSTCKLEKIADKATEQCSFCQANVKLNRRPK